MFRKIVTNMKKSVIFTWAISYFVSAVLAVGIMMWFYSGIYDTVQQQTKQMNEKTVSRITMKLEHKISEIKNFSFNIENNDYVKTIMNLNHLEDPRNYYYLDNIRNAYRVSGARENVFDGWFIYFFDIDTIVSNLGVTNARDFYEAYVDGKTGDFIAWQQSLKEHAMGRFMKTGMDIQDAGYEDYIAYVRGMPFNVTMRTKAVVVSLISHRSIEAFEELEGGNSELYIIDQGGEMLYGGRSDGGYRYDSFGDETDTTIEKYGNQKYVVTHQMTENAKWKCIVVMPFGEYYKNISHMRTLLLFGIIFILIGNTAFTCYFVYKNYIPIRAILTDLSHNAKDGIQSKKVNEYEYIRTNINGIISENDRIKGVLEAENEYIANNFIRGILQGADGQMREIREALQAVGMSVACNAFCVVVLQIENLNELFSENEMNDFERQKTALFIFKNILEELFGEQYSAYVFDQGDDIICLVNLENEPAALQNIVSMIDKARGFIAAHFKIEATAGIGEILDGSNGIHISYKEAMTAIVLKTRLGCRQTILYSAAQKIANADGVASNRLAERFVNTIAIYNEKDIADLIDEVLRAQDDVESVIITVYEIVVSILRNYEGYMEYDSMVQEIKLLELLSITDFKTLHDWFAGAVRVLFRINEAAADKNNQDVVSRAYAYVEQHYDDVNLSIDSIGDVFGMTGKKFSKLFMEQTGKRFIEYMNQFRIERAKEILNDRNINLEELAKRTGFASQRTFMRLFKAYEGITPGQYKALHKNKK